MTQRARNSQRRAWATALLLALLLGGPAGEMPASAASSTEAGEAHYEQALDHMNRGNGRAAIIELRNALQLDPDNYDARLLLGKLRLLAGEPSSAEKDLRLALSARHSDETEILLGRALIDQVKYNDVIRIVSRDALTDEDLQKKLLVLADAYWGLSQLDEVEALYDEVLAAWPENRNAKLGIARLHVARQQRGAAARLTDSLLAEHPDFAEAWVLVADLAIHAGNTEQALHALDQALTQDQNDINALIHRARLYLEIGKWAAAETDIAVVQTLQPRNPFALYLQVAHQFATKDLIGADGNFTDLIKLLPQEPPVLLLGSLIKISFGEFAQAERLLTRYLNLRPRNAAARRTLGLVLIRLNNSITAMNLLEPLVAASPDDSAALHLLATAYLQLGRQGMAARMLQQILERGRTDAEEMARSGLIDLAEAAGVGGWSPDPQLRILPVGLAEEMFHVVELLEAEQLDQARDRVRVLKRRYPDNPFLLTLEGLVLSARGNHAAARASFERSLTIEPEFLVALDQLDDLDREAGRPELIEQRLRELLLRRPRSESLVLRLADNLSRKTGIQGSIEFLEDRRTRFIDSVTIARALIEASLAVGSSERALKILEEVLITHASDPSVLSYVRAMLTRLQAHDKAIEISRRLIDLEPRSIIQRLALARGLIDAGQPEPAREVLQAAREMAPDNLEVTRGLIGLALERGDVEGAIGLADGIRPYDEVLADRLHGHILVNTGRGAEAVAVLVGAYGKTKASATAIDLYVARRTAGDLAAAIAGLQQHLAQAENDRPARHVLASSLGEAQRFAEAMAHYQTLAQQDPDDVLALNNLAWLRDRLGFADALGYAERAYRIAPDEGQVADTYGWLLVRSDRTKDGVKILRRAVAQAPGDPNVRYRLAYALEKAGNGSEALMVLQVVLRTDRSFEERAKAEALLRTLSN